MSGCGCKGHYHNGGCSDQNVIFWGLGRAPVNPTEDEITAQKAENEATRKRVAAGLTRIITGTTGAEVGK